ncbi:MAG: hypothetical protein D6685_19525 [Bacteroidetes bacterium]|nr:MAG: hypothetical protein D6685_19525 [Bacteroidota bacterium]
MSTPHKGQTGKVTEVKLPSKLERVMWTRLMAAPGARVGLMVFTRYVGNGAPVEIKLTDQSGKTHGTFKDKLFANRLAAQILVPSRAEAALFAEVKLPRHGLTMQSGALLLMPPIIIENARWSAREARRGDLLTLEADVKGPPDGTEAEITIYEHDADGAHDLVTKLPLLVQKGKVRTEWTFEYVEDTDDIPTDDELEQGYTAPEYFFRVSIHGVTADSEKLTFQDRLEVRLVDEQGVPIAEHEYVLHLADGSTREGRLDTEGRLQADDLPPGPLWVEYPESEADAGGPLTDFLLPSPDPEEEDEASGEASS